MKHLLLSLLLFVLVPFSLLGGDTAQIAYVIDGDTVVVLVNGKKESVRLIGIDTPESKRNAKAFRDAERSGSDVEAIVASGKRARAFVKSQIRKGGKVSLEFDVEKRDRYGRLLAYIYLPDGRMLNEIIVRSGYASVMTIPPNVKHRDLFQKAYRHARQNKLGLWSEE